MTFRNYLYGVVNLTQPLLENTQFLQSMFSVSAVFLRAVKQHSHLETMEQCKSSLPPSTHTPAYIVL